jgi:hypothetical protein
VVRHSLRPTSPVAQANPARVLRVPLIRRARRTRRMRRGPRAIAVVASRTGKVAHSRRLRDAAASTSRTTGGGSRLGRGWLVSRAAVSEQATRGWLVSQAPVSEQRRAVVRAARRVVLADARCDHRHDCDPRPMRGGDETERPRQAIERERL